MNGKMPSMVMATGWLRSSVAAARSRIVATSRASASM
jgi:hypothetical protein